MPSAPSHAAPGSMSCNAPITSFSKRNPPTNSTYTSRNTLPPGSGLGIRGRIFPRLACTIHTISSTPPASSASPMTANAPSAIATSATPPLSSGARSG